MQTLSESPRNVAMKSKIMKAVDRLLGMAEIGTYTVEWELKEGTIMKVFQDIGISESPVQVPRPDLRERIVSAIETTHKESFFHNFSGIVGVTWVMNVSGANVQRKSRQTQT